MAANVELKPVYEFGPFRLDPAGRTLTRLGQPVALAPRVFDTLLVFVERRGRILEKDELMNLIWPQSLVEESNLAYNVSQLRKALQDDGSEQRYIETLNKRGYRFVAEVRELIFAGNELMMSRRAEAKRLPEGSVNGEPASISLLSSPLSLVNPTTTTETTLHTQLHQFPVEKQTALYPLSSPTKSNRRFHRTAILVLATCLIVVALAFALTWPHLFTARSTAPFHNIRLAKLTNSGNIVHAVLSPDGRYVAEVREEVGQQSLWVRQVVTTSERQIVPPSEMRYQGLTFSPDGNFVFYTAYEKPVHIGALYQAPILGGTAPQKVIHDIDSPVTFSPDGRRIAFVRNYPGQAPDQGEVAIIVFDLKGKGEQKLATRQRPNQYSFQGPAWSPDGKLIACAVVTFDADGAFMNVVGVNVDNGQETPLVSERLAFAGQIVWAKDGRGLIVIASHATSPIFTDQLWYYPYPKAGEPQRITNDLNDYRQVSVSADFSTMIALQSNRVARMWLVPKGDAARATQITSGSGDSAGNKLGLTWTPEGQIVYASLLSGNPDLWIMDKDGSRRKQLTTDDRLDFSPVASPDGRYIIFAAHRLGQCSHIWRMNADGSNAQQLTFGQGEDSPAISPDGRWVIYSTRTPGEGGLWKVPMDGGTPTHLTNLLSYRPAISPDGQLIACYQTNAEQSLTKFVILPFEGGAAVKSFGLAPADLSTIQWSNDGRALSYVDTRQGISNIWQQPLDGSPPHPITDFKTERIFRFAWSRDNQWLACERGTVINDLVLITDLKQ